MLFYVKRTLAYAQRVPSSAIPKRTPIAQTSNLPAMTPMSAKDEKVDEDEASTKGKPQKTVPVNSAVGGKGVASKNLGVGGKGGHPIRGMEV